MLREKLGFWAESREPKIEDANRASFFKESSILAASQGPELSCSAPIGLWWLSLIL